MSHGYTMAPCRCSLYSRFLWNCATKGGAQIGPNVAPPPPPTCTQRGACCYHHQLYPEERCKDGNRYKPIGYCSRHRHHLYPEERVGVWGPTTRHGVTRDDDWWASAYAELDGERRDNNLYWFSPPEYIASYVQSGVNSILRPALGFRPWGLFLFRFKEPCPLYIAQEASLLVGYNIRVLVGLQGSNVIRITCEEFLVGLDLLLSLRSTQGLCPTSPEHCIVELRSLLLPLGLVE
jgi:hypothetical protein